MAFALAVGLSNMAYYGYEGTPALGEETILNSGSHFVTAGQ